MNIPIKYNDNLDEFTHDMSLQMRLENYINKHFYLAYTVSRLVPIYLVGGVIRDLIYAWKPKDMDFVVLGIEHLEWVLQVLKAYNIIYSLNRLGGYKINYNDTVVDFWLAEDLLSSEQYNVDGLYFDLRTNSNISVTFDDFIKNGLKEVNKENNIENDRLKKLVKFEEKFFS